MVEAGRGIEDIAPGMDVHQLFLSYGLDTGEQLKELIKKQLNVIGLASDTTFSALNRLTAKDFFVCATNMTTRRPCYFSHENHPDMKLADALYASMSIPFIFQPYRLKNGDIFADGGLTANVPIGVFDDEERTLVVFMSHTPAQKIESCRQYVIGVMNCILSSQCPTLDGYVARNKNMVFTLDGPDNEFESLSLQTSSTYIDKMQRYGYNFALCHIVPEISIVVSATLAYLLRDCF